MQCMPWNSFLPAVQCCREATGTIWMTLRSKRQILYFCFRALIRLLSLSQWLPNCLSKGHIYIYIYIYIFIYLFIYLFLIYCLLHENMLDKQRRVHLIWTSVVVNEKSTFANLGSFLVSDLNFSTAVQSADTGDAMPGVCMTSGF